MKQKISPPIRHLINFTITTRILVIVWTIFTNVLVTNYDTSSTVNTNASTLWNQITSSFANWDSIYFVRIAKMGFYEYEHFHAFFPLYPFVMRYTSKLFIPLMEENVAIVLSGIIIANASFIFSVIILYKLTCLFFDERCSLLSAKLYAL